MKLRIARKILNMPSEPDGGACARYRDNTLGRALRRMEKTASSKANQRLFYRFMDQLGLEGRAHIVARHDAGAALRMLCEQGEGLKFS